MNAWDKAKAAVLARHGDVHIGDCEYCAAYVEELIHMEELGRISSAEIKPATIVIHHPSS